jgi:hypothetical protein
MSVEFHREAEQELAEAAFHYDGELQGLGDRFLTEVRRATMLLDENPGMGQRIDEQLHRVVLRRFPFSLIYAQQLGKVFILAVAHQRRRPGYWRARRDR